MNKREIVEEYLNNMALTVGMIIDANDPYPCDDELDEIIKDSLGLIEIEDRTGWWSEPTDAQVEQLYPNALKWFDIE